MKKRESEKELKELAKQFKAVAVIGPRQSGKTTLVSKVFSNKPYVNLENPDVRKFALEAGRVGYLFLLPFTLEEIDEKEREIDEVLFKGCYPALFDGNLTTSRYYSNYIRTYVERDVRLIKNITNLYLFERFLRLCAGRVGQLLNMNSMAVEVGVDVKTIGSWLGVLEASFIVFRLRPYHKNFNKRVVKMPKLYFYDTGLAVSML
jgi:predicted AAA+ superfamily ATPase